MTRELIDALMVLLVLMNLRLVGSSRLAACIQTVAIEGMTLGLLPLLVGGSDGMLPRTMFIAVASFALRGVLFPRLLLRNVRDANVHREIEPFVGYTLSILAGVSGLVLSFWMASRIQAGLPTSAAPASSLMIPVALATILTGLFVIVSRRLAVNQVLGYIVMENGIYVLGLAMVENIPALVELGVLMDAFVAVFVMTIATYHISREFDHIDADRLNRLRG